MRLRLPVFFLFLISLPSPAQTYTNVVRHRTALWTQTEIVYRTARKWSFQLDHLYWRQANDANEHDLDLVRYPLLQVFRPWINYQLSKPVRLSLSPISLWWSWSQTGQSSKLMFQKDLRLIPQITVSRPLHKGTFMVRYRNEFRWRSGIDTLTSEYGFLDDKLPPDRFDMRPWLLLRWVVPLSGNRPPEKSWYLQSNVEVIGLFSKTATRLDQQRLYFTVGRRLSDTFRLEMGLMNSLAVRKNEGLHLRTFQFIHALTFNLSIENRRRAQVRPGTLSLLNAHELNAHELNAHEKRNFPSSTSSE